MSKIFEIYQIPTTAEESVIRDCLYMDLDWLRRKGIKVSRANYAQVYRVSCRDEVCLEDIFFAFNRDERPLDYTGRSISLSDVVVVENNGSKTAFYCDRIGWKDVSEDFFSDEK